jgi:hypothetical protein
MKKPIATKGQPTAVTAVERKISDPKTEIDLHARNAKLSPTATTSDVKDAF